ncbi:hypothetical protein GOFOIKOB_0309 [Methylobacterium tardum]|uniref:Uncharacterized protein n=1 Tax=Methylobacterium tardum TaxID=374432 RepID=A0AA37TKC8_9HYPH|nr:hypothetical protein [Methylobacterium tardum]URD36855.1 hypothetical protein M6G65_31895 [Methylobacterium tardum]GJE47288.1 hypothetical protein GOFOIKOB_0309 [Methylobacterium tardum]GLS71341.1 hypothetical protein GCM10007890_33540 [Methylobacterium tardum]
MSFRDAIVTDTHGAAALLGWPVSRVEAELRAGKLPGRQVSGKAARMFLGEAMRLQTAIEIGGAGGRHMREFPVPGSPTTKAYRWAVVLPGEGSYELDCLRAGPEGEHLIDRDDYAPEEDL